MEAPCPTSLTLSTWKIVWIKKKPPPTYKKEKQVGG
jgi:hypothetical protein